MALALKGKPAQLQFDGQGSHHSGTVHATLQDFALASMGPYLAPFLVPQLTGTLQAQAQAQWRPEGVQLTVQRLALRDTALHAGEAGDWPRFQSLELGNARIDLEKRRVHLGTLALRAPSLRLERDADGQWMTQTWFPPTGAPPHGRCQQRNGQPPCTAPGGGRRSGQRPWRSPHHTLERGGRRPVST